MFGGPLKNTLFSALVSFFFSAIFGVNKNFCCDRINLPPPNQVNAKGPFQKSFFHFFPRPATPPRCSEKTRPVPIVPPNNERSFFSHCFFFFPQPVKNLSGPPTRRAGPLFFFAEFFLFHRQCWESKTLRFFPGKVGSPPPRPFPPSPSGLFKESPMISPKRKWVGKYFGPLKKT